MRHSPELAAPAQTGLLRYAAVAGVLFAASGEMQTVIAQESSKDNTPLVKEANDPASLATALYNAYRRNRGGKLQEEAERKFLALGPAAAGYLASKARTHPEAAFRDYCSRLLGREARADPRYMNMLLDGLCDGKDTEFYSQALVETGSIGIPSVHGVFAGEYRKDSDTDKPPPPAEIRRRSGHGMRAWEAVLTKRTYVPDAKNPNMQNLVYLHPDDVVAPPIVNVLKGPDPDLRNDAAVLLTNRLSLFPYMQKSAEADADVAAAVLAALNQTLVKQEEFLSLDADACSAALQAYHGVLMPIHSQHASLRSSAQQSLDWLSRARQIQEERRKNALSEFQKKN